MALIASSLLMEACESCPDRSIGMTAVESAPGTLVVTFVEDVFIESSDTRMDGLLITLTVDSEELGRWQGSRSTPASGAVLAAKIIDRRSAEFQVDLDQVSGQATLHVRADLAGACDGPNGQTNVTIGVG